MHKELKDLCKVVEDELKDATERIHSAGDKLTAGDINYLDKLTHIMKSLKTTIAMTDAEDSSSYDYSGRRSYNGSYDGSYDGSYEDMSNRSYARGRGARRDSMGRYSSEDGYSRAEDDMISELRSMMPGLPEEKKREVQRFIKKMEEM